MSKAEREKGKRGERLLAALLRLNGFGAARRGQQYSGTETSADIVGVPGLHIECKFKADNNDSPDFPVVFQKKERESWIAVLDGTDFLTIYNGYMKSIEASEK